MGTTTRELNTLLQRHGLFPDKHAVTLLKNHVEKSKDPKGDVASIVARIKGNPALLKNKVPKDMMQETLAAMGDDEDVNNEKLSVLDHTVVPISVYDPVRKVFVRKPGDERSLRSGQDFTRIDAFRERFEVLEQRVLNNPVFAKKAFAMDGASHEALSITRISGIRRAEGATCVLGLLTQPQEGIFYLEDTSGKVQVDISNAESNMGLFCENCIIVAEGEMKKQKRGGEMIDIFEATLIAMPPAEERDVTCSRFPALAVPNHRKPYTPEELADCQNEERASVNWQFVVLSDVWLDRPRVMGGLQKLFGRFEIACRDAEEADDVFFVFVLMGNFLSQGSPHGIAEHREHFDKLAVLLESFEALLKNACFVVMPGPNDVIAGNGLMLPRNPLPDVIAQEFKDKINASTFTSSPCRLKFCTQELVFSRDDICTKMRKFSRKPTDGKKLEEHTVKTLLCQGHLAPLPLHAAPIDWGHDHALRLYPLPSLLDAHSKMKIIRVSTVLGDRVGNYDMTFMKTQVSNPGCFATDFSFVLYSPVERTVDILYIDEVDEMPSGERARRAEELALAKKRKERKRKEKKAAREAAVDEDGNPIGKKKSDSKTPKTHKKGGQFSDGLDEKGAITSFFARRSAEANAMEEEREGERGARRRIRQGGSADNSSDSDTSDDEVEGEELHSGNEEGAGGADAVSDEDDEVKLLRRAPAHAPAVSKRRRLSDSDDDAEVPEACNEAHQSRKRVEPASTRNDPACDDTEDFSFQPRVRAVAYTSV